MTTHRSLLVLLHRPFIGASRYQKYVSSFVEALAVTCIFLIALLSFVVQMLRLVDELVATFTPRNEKKLFYLVTLVLISWH